MNILVCVKQVPEPEAVVNIDESARWVSIGTGSAFRMNRFDECAVEAAVQIKETLPETDIDIVSVGPEKSEEVIRRAIGMGADQGTHIITESDGFVAPESLAQWIADTAAARKADLVLCGAMSEDLMQGQVGPILAEYLSIPCATNVVQMAIEPDNKGLVIEREIEGGFRERVALSFPALLTIQTGINQPRYPALSKLLRANQIELTIHKANFIKSSRHQKIESLSPPRKLRDSIVLEGAAIQKAEELVNLLKQRSFV